MLYLWTVVTLAGVTYLELEIWRVLYVNMLKCYVFRVQFIAPCPPVWLGALFVSITLKTLTENTVPLTQLTWCSWPVLSRVLAAEAFTGWTESRPN